MSQITRLVHALSQPIALEPAMLFRFAAVFRRKLAGEIFDGAKLHAELGIQQPNERPKREAARVGVVSIVGVLSQHPQSLGASTADIGASIDAAVANPNIDAILLDIDSPGGEVSGIPEVAAKIAAARDQKPVLALVNGMAASAAYWLASQATEIMITPSGMAGSIGVYMLHEDWSKNLEQEGVKITAMSAGKFKLEGAPWEPLSDEAKADIQAKVDTYYSAFTRAVGEGRKASAAEVRAGYGQGRVLLAKEAVEANLADRIGTFEDAVARLQARKPLRQKSRAQAARALALDAAETDPNL